MKHRNRLVALTLLLVFVLAVVVIAASPSTIVYITRTGHKYHRGYCQYLRQSKIAITLGEAQESGYGPCSVCQPPK